MTLCGYCLPNCRYPNAKDKVLQSYVDLFGLLQVTDIRG